eukprot:759977-Hanusia_phi.AAC.3
MVVDSSFDRSGDLSEDSNDDILQDQNTLMLSQVPKLDLNRINKQSSALHTSSIQNESWRVYVQLIDAENIASKDSFFSGLFCCASLILWNEGSELDLPIQHNVGDVSINKSLFSFELEPQQRSKPIFRSSSPVWNQGFVFADTYPSFKVMQATARANRIIKDNLRIPIDGNDLVLFLTLHDVASDKGEVFIGKTFLSVRVGQPQELTLTVKKPSGEPLMNDKSIKSNIRVRIAYGSSQHGKLSLSEAHKNFVA